MEWHEKLWGRRYRPIIISDEEAAQVARLRYILEQGVKENLVASPRRWPGLHCANALIEGKPLEGIWYDRTLQYEANRRGKEVDPEAFIERYQLQLEPIPCWAHLSPDEYRHRILELVEDIEEQAARRIKATGVWPVGVDAIRRQNPHERPMKSKKSPAPLFHAASRAVRRAMHDGYRLFVEAYRHAAACLKAGDRSVKFPEGCFPPRLPFVRTDAALPNSRAGPAFVPV